MSGELPSHWWLNLGAMELFILGMATWRLTSMIVDEDGPLYIFERFRYWIGIRRTEDGLKFGTNVIAEGLSCVWCTSVWVALGLTLLYLFWPDITVVVSVPLALSAVAIIIQKVVDDD